MDGWMDGWIVYFILSMKKYVVCGMFAFFSFLCDSSFSHV